MHAQLQGIATNQMTEGRAKQPPRPATAQPANTATPAGI